MAGEETLVFWLGSAGFGIATVIFASIGLKKQTAGINAELFVSFITSISYVVMALGLAIVIAPNGDPIYWSRWLFYIGSCSILTTDVALLKGESSRKIAEIGLYTGLTMLAGFLASYVTTPEKWWFFGLSSIAYIAMLFELNRGELAKKASMPKILAFVTLTWSLFPVVWVLSPTGFGVINIFVEAILYGVLDLVTKIIFGLYLIFKVK
ncbi:MAG: bacteriorhodopsin [Candidatus Hodarchaeota archaeon]